MRALMFALFALFTPSVFAQTWVEIVTDDEAIRSVDPASIRKSYGYAQAWWLIDFKKFNPAINGRSSKWLLRFKCDERELARASFVNYSRLSGAGTVVATDNNSYPSYTPVVPGTLGASMLDYVCDYLKGEEWTKVVEKYGGVSNVAAVLKANNEAEQRASAAQAAADAMAAAADAATAANEATDTAAGDEDAISAAEQAAGLMNEAQPTGQTTSVSVTSVVLGSAIDKSLRVAKPKVTFKPSDTIYVSISTENPKSEKARLGIRWIYEPTGQLVNTEHQVLAGDVDAVNEFHMYKPDGWPEGGYLLNVYVDGEVVQSLRIRVKP